MKVLRNSEIEVIMMGERGYLNVMSILGNSVSELKMCYFLLSIKKKIVSFSTRQTER